MCLGPSLEGMLAAARTGNVEQLQGHCFQKEHEVPTSVAQNLLKEAVENSHTSVVEFLLARFPDVIVDGVVVRSAVRTGSIPVVSKFLEHDPASINMQFDRVGTPLITACMSQQSINFIRYLLVAGADPNQEPDVTGYPIALVAAFYKDTSVVDLLLQHGARLEHSGALGAAARRRNASMIQYLLQKGAKPETDATVPGGDHPLFSAVAGGDVGIVRSLMDNDKGGELVDRNDKTILDVTLDLRRKGEDRDEIIRLLLDIAEKEADS